MRKANMSKLKKSFWDKPWLCTPVIPSLRRIREEGHESEATLSYIIKTHLKQANKYKYLTMHIYINRCIFSKKK